MRKLYIKRERALACFGINYRCIVGENVQDHLAWAAAQDREGLMMTVDEKTLRNGGTVCLEIGEEKTTLFVIAYREHSELVSNTVKIPAGKMNLHYTVQTIYDGDKRLALRLSEDLETIDVNGVTLHYAVYGEGKPVVLVHGNGEDHHLFDTEIMQLTAAGYKVYAPDSRGHGANAREQEYHYADMMEDIYEFIKKLELDKPAFYGHSDGGIIGLLLESNHPGTLGLLAASGANLQPEGLLPSFLAEFKMINDSKPNPLITLMLTEPHIDPASLESIQIPVLLTTGEHDLVLREETQRIADHLPDMEWIEVTGEDHGSYIEGSPVMGNLLIDFLKERNY